MKIAIDCGHTLTGKDTGAEGNGYREQNCTREIGEKVIAKLQALGHTVIKCYKDTCSSLIDSLSYRTNTANNNNVDLYVSIHLNAFNGQAYGTEVWTYGGKQFVEATKVLNNLVGLGYTNRGIKNGSELYVLKNTKAKAMLIECCFIDNKLDMNRYNAENIANAIVKGICGETNVENSINKETNTSKLDHSIPDNKYVVWKSPNGLGYIESIPEKGRLIIHLDKYNYLNIQDDKKEGNRVWITTRTKGSKELI